MGAHLTFGIIVAPLGQDRGLEIANFTSINLVPKLALASITCLLINFLLTKRVVKTKKPFLISLAITIIGVVIFIPFFISIRQSFLNYQDSTTSLYHYLESKTISSVYIVQSTDTIQIENTRDFLRDIGSAKYKPGRWKYVKKMEIIIGRVDGKRDLLSTNGKILGEYKEKFFEVDENFLPKYLAK